jgi:pimeloyl-ACP methyl ester carboxylesterase
MERDLLEQWWRQAAQVDERVPGPEVRGQFGRTPVFVQRALDALSYSRFFVGLTERFLIGDVKQVRAYLTDDDLRAQIQARVTAAVTSRVGAETRVLVGHSLGSVVAYEAVCAHPEWPVTTLVTLGSPLGIRNLIFDKLRPAPGERGAWPAGVRHWINIADKHDLVALVKQLRPLFGDGNQVADFSIDNGATAHDARPYLTAKETGRAIAAGLAS